MLTVDVALSVLSERCGAPVRQTQYITEFALPDGRELCLENTSFQVMIWLEDRGQNGLPVVARAIPYGANQSRNSNLSGRLRHNPTQALRTLGYPVPVLRMQVDTEEQLAEVLDWYQGSAIDLDRSALEEMKQTFLRHYPDFTSFADASGGYWEEERYYKQGLIDRIAQVLAEAAGMSEADIGYQLLEILCRKPSNLLGWRSVNLIDGIRQEAPGVIEAACARLVLNPEPVDTAIERFVSQVWPRFARGREKSLPYSESRSLPTMIMALAHPDKMLAIRFEPTFDAGRRLLRRRLFANAPLTGDEARQVLQMGRRIYEVMQDEWGWQPRDLWDVQGFIWVTCQGQAQQADSEEQAAKRNDIGQDAARQQARNVILYGPPGTGKTYATMELSVGLANGSVPGERASLRQRYEALRDAGQIEFVTFHQAYSYEEFVEGLRPVTGENSGAGFRLEPRPGVFRRIAERALAEFKAAQDEGRAAMDYVLVIDEINRANISKVFGELITLLEADKRFGEDNAQSVTLPYSGDAFIVPPNLHVLGTMNTADRSIALLDTALRRRFQFEELMPDPALLPSDLDGVDLAAVLEAINNRIEYLFDRDHQIGHAYFLGCRSRADVDEVIRRKVIPLLVEYFHEDWEKVRVVLNEEDDTGMFISRTQLMPPPLLALEHAGQDTRWRYQVRASFPDDAYKQLIG